MSYFTECEPSKCSTDRETVPELHALVRCAATLASVTVVLEFNRFSHPNTYMYIYPKGIFNCELRASGPRNHLCSVNISFGKSSMCVVLSKWYQELLECSENISTNPR